MLSRRRFMFVLGGAATGLWLASTGLVRLERGFVLSLAGSCSFCGKDRAEAHALVGTAGRATRICDECIGLCLDIIGEDLGDYGQPNAAPNVEAEDFQQRVGELLRQLAQGRDCSRSDALLADLRRSVQPSRADEIDQFRCSFCGAHRADVMKLVAGPRVFICDGCVGEATAVVSHVLRPA
jgi:hypothetical protein